EKPQLDVKFSNGTTGDMKDAYVWVDDEEKLKQLVEISTRDEDYLVDTIALHDVMGILGPVFANPNICKVFHGADNDVIWLQRDFHIYVVNLFDTAKACDVLSKPQRSLAYLLETYCGVITNKFYQREDWRQRPLPKDMLEYARMDVHYLLYIADCLVAELKLQKNVWTSKDLSKSDNPASLDDNKFDFVYEASRRSNAVCLQLFTKELEASPGQSAASSIISRHLNDPGSSSDNSQARMHDESLKHILSDNAIVALAKKVPKVARTKVPRKSPVYPNCRIYANDGRFVCHCDRKKLEWYLQRDLAKLVDEDPPAIMLLFEPKGRSNDIYTRSKKNICVGCGEGNHYVRHRIIPSCYWIHFPEHLKSHRSHGYVLVCLDCHEKAHSFAEEYKNKVASDYGIPLFVHKVVNSSRGVSPLELCGAARVLLRHGPRMPPQCREELTQVVRTYYGGREISDEDLKNALLVGNKKIRMRKKRRLSNNSSSKNTVSDTALNSDINSGAVIATCSSKLSLLGHGPHGKQVVDYLLKEHGEDGIPEFCQRWRQVLVEAINPRFLPAGWVVTLRMFRVLNPKDEWGEIATSTQAGEFGDFSIYNPANKGSPSAAKDLTMEKK
ncbi:RRP6-like protein 3 isoform X1, partial [Tanacetum coccineum]